MSTQILNITSPFAELKEHPVHKEKIDRRDSQMILGEAFEVAHVRDGWARGVSLLDGYEGWVECHHLSNEKIDTTHAVTLRLSNAYPQPDFKTHPSLTMTFMSRVKANPMEAIDGFLPISHQDQTLWVPENHLLPLADLSTNPADPVETAKMFDGSSYIYGGRTAWGMDCSALIQVALQRNGIFCPRDADMQMPVLGESVALSNIQRGDLVYLPGHVGMMVDSENVIDATVLCMKTIVEPLSVLIERYKVEAADPILDIRRISFAP